MSAPLRVVETEAQSEQELAAGINREHLRAFEAARSAIEHARRAGELLLTAKALLGHGRFGVWIAQNLTFSESTANRYMRIAKHWAVLQANSSRVADLSLREALHTLDVLCPGYSESAPSKEQPPPPVHVYKGDAFKTILVRFRSVREMRSFPHGEPIWSTARLLRFKTKAQMQAFAKEIGKPIDDQTWEIWYLGEPRYEPFYTAPAFNPELAVNRLVGAVRSAVAEWPDEVDLGALAVALRAELERIEELGRSRSKRDVAIELLAA